MARPIIPEFEPEVVRAVADRRHFGAPETVATTTIKSLEVHGVMLSSRCDKADEYRTMSRMVESVDAPLRRIISDIWCDSKANACYSVTLNPCTAKDARVIADQLDAACMKQGGGHNGISISGSQGHIEVDPHWAGDELL
ncbi:hypothetical protein BJ123_13121 [Rhodopseudomonas thermotolerans]|uniref:Uncharacterized protein n=2 Tax=Rhodopseudomonas TaxID=1073 RepID=A0A336JTM8_9BRAD|nr:MULTISPECIES: hypothetical protein [Rhodopseudomonas]RED25553.1 hypothetical protein BJ125_13121 [Rhodopseudomonas pentothenatexigens]REF90383.1 hypothetical protein BJ123_13121 [Rhodopseudomonas thermotolerans]SSW93165.1 hypothetical protein SAMN05892882_13121 [Rhodopseudomonas pentothenatexigens]